MLFFYLLFLFIRSASCQAESDVLNVWKDNRVTVDLIERHLRISLLRSVSSPDQLSEEEVIALSETRKKVATLFEKAFQTRHHLAYTPVYGEAKPLYTEMIPVDGASQYTDMAEKIHRSIYILSAGERDNCKLKDEQIEKIKSLAAAAFETPIEIPGERTESQTSWQVPWKNLKKAKSIVKESLGKEVVVTGTSDEPSKAEIIEGEFDKGTQDTIIRQISSCVFCNEEIIKRQKVTEGEHYYLVVNNIPYIPNKHLMAVTKEHISSRDHLTKEELIEEHRLFVKVGQAFQRLFGKEIPYCQFTQTGFLAGETVPHPHTHFLAGMGNEELQYWLKNVLSSWEGTPPHPLTKDEMQKMSENYRNALEVGNH